MSLALYPSLLPSVLDRLHDPRHGCATFMLAAGVLSRAIMEVLWHSRISVTMNTYAHVRPALRQEAADAIDELLGAWGLPVASIRGTCNHTASSNAARTPVSPPGAVSLSLCLSITACLLKASVTECPASLRRLR
jgi:hypothetical protein